jgi:flagellar basal-body rod protein FlgB
MEGKLNLFAAIAKRMDWLGQRQKVLADNIANSDTPGYVPRDLKDSDFSKLLQKRSAPVEPTLTNAAHRPGTVPRAHPARPEAQKRTYETAPSGNAVILEEQLIKVAKTQDDYQTMANLYRKHMDMFRMAVRGGN